ncbi:MAG: L-threonylcarbamoyladenylate synthase [Eubacteriales bacterium]
MKTIILKEEKNQLDSNKRRKMIKQAGEILRGGGLVALPTETVYGLGADALNEDAARKTYEAKGRPSDNPLIVHISKLDSLEEIVKEIPEKSKIVAKHYWPGPLTMVFEKNCRVPYGTTGGLETVAVRMPDHELARELIEAGGGFISAPSANSSGRPSPTSAAHVAEDLSGKIDMIIDGGDVEIGVESTILDMTSPVPMILRPGAITKEMLEALIGEVQVDPAIVDEHSTERPKAPGMKYRHYAPKATLTIIEGDVENDGTIEAINWLVAKKEKEGYKVGVIGTEESLPFYKCQVVKSVGNRVQKESVAHNLYKVLRAFDEEDVDYIYSESFFTDGIGYAIMNRLLKAAGNRIIKAQDVIIQKRGDK